MKTAEYWIQALSLQPHPEGGHYRETYRSNEKVPAASLPSRFTEDHTFSTAIYFLLRGNTFSAFHKIKQDEMWHFYDGEPLTIHSIAPDATYATHTLGLDLEKGEAPQITIPAGHYFAAAVNKKDSFTLTGCTVAPGFEFADFIMPNKNELLEMFPKHAQVITQFTREAAE